MRKTNNKFNAANMKLPKAWLNNFDWTFAQSPLPVFDSYLAVKITNFRNTQDERQ